VLFHGTFDRVEIVEKELLIPPVTTHGFTLAKARRPPGLLN
jgi:hypothetical protein